MCWSLGYQQFLTWKSGSWLSPTAFFRQIRRSFEELIAAVRAREAGLLAGLERLADGKDLALAAQEGQTVARRRDLEALVSSAVALVGENDVAVAEGGAALVRRAREVLERQAGFPARPCEEADLTFVTGDARAVISRIQSLGVVANSAPDPDQTEWLVPGGLRGGVRNTITLQLRDAAGRGLTRSGGRVTASVQPARAASDVVVRDLANGSYVIDLTPVKDLQDQELRLNVRLDGRAVRGSPCALTVPAALMEFHPVYKPDEVLVTGLSAAIRAPQPDQRQLRFGQPRRPYALLGPLPTQGTAYIKVAHRSEGGLVLGLVEEPLAPFSAAEYSPDCQGSVHEIRAREGRAREGEIVLRYDASTRILSLRTNGNGAVQPVEIRFTPWARRAVEGCVLYAFIAGSGLNVRSVAVPPAERF
jgi:hypothetical protein